MWSARRSERRGSGGCQWQRRAGGLEWQRKETVALLGSERHFNERWVFYLMSLNYYTITIFSNPGVKICGHLCNLRYDLWRQPTQRQETQQACSDIGEQERKSASGVRDICPQSQTLDVVERSIQARLPLFGQSSCAWQSNASLQPTPALID